MKQIYLILFFGSFFSVSAIGQDGWARQSASFSLGLSAVYAIDSLNVWASGQEGLLIHSNDGGVSWDSIPNGSQKGIYTIEFINADTGFVAGRDNGSTGPGLNSLLQRTNDGGLSWTFQNMPGGSQNSIMDIDFVNGPAGEQMRGISVGGLAHVWTSYDCGETWKAASGDCGEGNFNSCFFTDSLKGWFVGTPSNVKPYTIMHTTDGCKSFLEQTDPVEVKLNGVCFGSDLKGVAVGNAGTVLYTSDGGANWEQSSDSNILGTTWFSVFLTETGLAWAVGNNGMIVYSIDWGHTWEPQESGVSDPLWEVHFVNDNEGWIVGGFSGSLILHTKNGGISATGIKDYREADNNTSILEQNFPNPFTSLTRISYKLKRSGIISLSVFDLSGRKIQTLVNDFQTAGEHTVDWDASHLSDGLYFCQLKINQDLVLVKKMVLER
jgi:photosystem II stability/assembly factor-like uncharacterized protein